MLRPGAGEDCGCRLKATNSHFHVVLHYCKPWLADASGVVQLRGHLCGGAPSLTLLLVPHLALGASLSAFPHLPSVAAEAWGIRPSSVSTGLLLETISSAPCATPSCWNAWENELLVSAAFLCFCT